MPKGAVLSEGSSGENISHFAAIRIRVTGLGNLRMKVYSLDDVRSKDLVAFPVGAASRIVQTRIVNFMEQRVSFELKTVILGEKFKIHRIVVFMKEVFTSYPGS